MSQRRRRNKVYHQSHDRSIHVKGRIKRKALGIYKKSFTRPFGRYLGAKITAKTRNSVLLRLAKRYVEEDGLSPAHAVFKAKENLNREVKHWKAYRNGELFYYYKGNVYEVDTDTNRNRKHVESLIKNQELGKHEEDDLKDNDE